MAEGGCWLGVGASVRGRAREGEGSCEVGLVAVQVPRLVCQLQSHTYQKFSGSCSLGGDVGGADLLPAIRVSRVSGGE
jgi:hypothetical protein